jgi:hypothetical protein
MFGSHFTLTFATIVVALSSLGGSVAVANSLKSVAETAGLLGTWTTDCSKPPTHANWYITYEATPTGGVQALYNNGPPIGSLLAVVESILIVSPTTVATRVRYSDPKWGKNNGDVFDMILELKDDRKHTIRSVRIDGHVFVKDGIMTSSGRPSAIHQRCLTKPLAYSPKRKVAQG